VTRFRLQRARSPLRDQAGLVTNAAFVTLSLARLTSSFGDQLQFTAESVLLLQLGAAPIVFGAQYTLFSFGRFSASVAAGGIVDRWPRHITLLATLSSRLLLVLLLAGLVFSHHITTAAVNAAGFTLGVFAAAEGSLFQPLLLSLVSTHEIPAATAWQSTGANLANFLGRVLGGILVSALGVGLSFLTNAFTFILLIGTTSIDARHGLQSKAIKPVKVGFFREIEDGWIHVRRHSAVWNSITALATLGALGTPMTVLAPLLLRNVYHYRENVGAGLGIYLGAWAMGQILAGPVFISLLANRPVVLVVPSLGLFWAASLIFTSLSTDLIMGAALAALGGMALGSMTQSVDAAIGIRIQDHFRGRCLILESALITLATGAGALVTSALGNTFDVRAVYLFSGLALAGVALAWLMISLHKGHVSVSGEQDQGMR
jgi:MFS family permease